MMERKYSVITGFLGGLSDRFVNYHPRRDIEEILKMASSIRGCSGVELIYPQDFGNPDRLPQLLEDYGLGVSSLNLNLKSEPVWRYGSISSPDLATRRTAVRYLKDAMDISADLGCNLVTTCILADGSDYPFELDYARAFLDTVEGIREAADHRADVKISLEYKLCEPRMHCLLGNAGKTAYLCKLVDRPNVGVTLDFGHALQSHEVPADSVAFLGTTGLLFYVHMNDNYRNWDWDMVPGTVNFWQLLEFIVYLQRVGYGGWITADVFPQRHDQVKFLEKTFEWMDMLFECASRIDQGRLFEMMNTSDALELMDFVRSAVLK